MLYAVKNLVKTRQRGAGYTLLIRSLHVAHGAMLALTGPSGCGKSTTLDLLGLSLAPDSADEFNFQPDYEALAVPYLWREGRLDFLASLRLRHIGYVLQSGELLPYLTCGENIRLTAELKGVPKAEALDTARELAESLGIGRLWKAMPGSLSVGERQRAAIARALAARPKAIIADEPTAALDPLHAEKVMDIFLDCVAKFKAALILATHNAAWAKAGGLKEIRFSLDIATDEDGEARVIATVDDRENGADSEVGDAPEATAINLEAAAL